jgi:ribosome-binding factor A
VREYQGRGPGFLTITDVRVTPDLRVARIFVSVFGNSDVRERTMEFLEEENAHLRGMLAGRLRLRFMPTLEFRLDETLDHVDRINTLIKQIHRDDPGPTDDSRG